jgi:hypothetical protein
MRIESRQLNLSESLLFREGFSGDFSLQTDKNTRLNISLDVLQNGEKWSLRGAALITKKDADGEELNLHRAYSFKQVDLHPNTSLSLGVWDERSSSSHFQVNFSDGFEAEDLGDFANESLLEIHPFSDAVLIKSHFVAGRIGIIPHGGAEPEEHRPEGER